MEFSNLKQEICATWLQLNSEQMTQIRITLLELSSSISHEIPRMREITRCSDFASSLRLLEKWKLLTPLKVDVILLLTEQVGAHTEMVREKIHQYKKLAMPSIPPVHHGLEQRGSFTPSNHVANSRLDQVYEYISENHGGRWADIGRSLGLSSLVSELQREPGLRQKDKVYQLLEEYNRNMDGDPIAGILRALESCGLKRQRNSIVRDILSN
ncbi:uncharacterized protein LOC119590028 [Penaeus monodon]|uniref:uncharacterized protein LOC119590028 n=1 Tax=Penaeus monodon TaxID=6687 RepID=UPI0018A73B36|nr:uncharacterized protein LOC119590028 [Penaeus monodon]XP_037794681.1 uncharacterized protein LOC119590028 [Penaeus monodon]